MTGQLVQLADASQFELAKIRIIKILRMNNLQQYIGPLTTYGAIAAINAGLTIDGNSYWILGSSSHNNIAPHIQLYNPNDSTTQPVYPINKLLALYLNDPGFFNIVTSKAFMLAYTNAATPVAWDDYTKNTVYTFRETVNSSTQFNTPLQGNLQPLMQILHFQVMQIILAHMVS
jgi:hypothetical protein